MNNMQPKKILCETSLRHAHLSAQDIQTLFGKRELTPVRALSQPGQFLAYERVNLVGPKSTISNVAIIGPARTQSQVEISQTDAFALGIKTMPSTITIQANDQQIATQAIIAQRHVHLDPKTAEKHNLRDGQIVTLKFDGPRGGTLDNTIVRVHENFQPAVHIDSDEANAMGFTTGSAAIFA